MRPAVHSAGRRADRPTGVKGKVRGNSGLHICRQPVHHAQNAVVQILCGADRFAGAVLNAAGKGPCPAFRLPRPFPWMES